MKDPKNVRKNLLTVLAESGLLPPGTAVYTLELLPGAVERLEPGGYDGSFLVSYYDTESGQRAVQ